MSAGKLQRKYTPDYAGINPISSHPWYVEQPHESLMISDSLRPLSNLRYIALISDISRAVSRVCYVLHFSSVDKHHSFVIKGSEPPDQQPVVGALSLALSKKVAVLLSLSLSRSPSTVPTFSSHFERRHP